MKVWSKNKALGDIDFAASDWVFTPIIQSGGKYDLKVSAESNGDNLKTGVILASMGIKYKEYCSMIARTFLIGPDKVRAVVNIPRRSAGGDLGASLTLPARQSQETNYTFVLDLQQHLLRVLKAGVLAKDVYAAGLQYVKDKKPALEGSYPKSIGYGVSAQGRLLTSALLMRLRRRRESSSGIARTCSDPRTIGLSRRAWCSSSTWHLETCRIPRTRATRAYS